MMFNFSRKLALLPLVALLASVGAPSAVFAADDCGCGKKKAAKVAAAPAKATKPVKAETKLDVTILGTTDVHGHVYPTNYYLDQGDEAVGLAKIQTLVKGLRKEKKHTLLVDSGDCLQGTPLTYHNARVDTKPTNPMVLAMNHMKFDAFAVGNHEYNYGLAYLNKAKGEAQYPFLSGNVFHHKTDKPVYTPYIIKQVGGAKIAILGFTTPGVAIWDRRHVEGKQDFRDIVSSAKRWIPEVKAKGADAIVVIIHSGLGGQYDATFSGYAADEGLPEENVCADMADAFPEIDAILLGHSHKDLPKLLHNGVLLTQAKKWGERLAVVDLSLEQVKGKWKVVKKDSRTLSTEGVKPDPEVLKVTQKAHNATVAYVNSVIGHSTTEWHATRARVEDTPIMDFINEVQREKTGAQLSAASVFNGAAMLPKGKVTVANIASLYVYENTLTTVELTGKQLKEYLEHSAAYFRPYKPGAAIFDDSKPAYNYDMIQGVEYEIDVTKPVGSRITKLDYQGKPVAETQTFTMAVNSYRQNGGGGFTMLKNAPLKEAIHDEIREIMLDYVKAKKEIAPEKVFKANWRIVPAGVVGKDGLHYN